MPKLEDTVKIYQEQSYNKLKLKILPIILTNFDHNIQSITLPYPRHCNPGVLLIFWIFRPRTMVNFGKFSSENTVIFDDFSPKIVVVRPKYVPQGSIQDWDLLKRLR